MGPQLTSLSCRLEGHGWAGSLGQGTERTGAEYSLAPRRLSRFGTVEQNSLDVCGRRRLPGGYPWRKEPSLWHPGALYGSNCERVVPLQAASLRCDLLYLQ